MSKTGETQVDFYFEVTVTEIVMCWANPQWSLAFANMGYKQILMCSHWISFATYYEYSCYGG